MAKRSIDLKNSMHLDVLKEIGNVGASSAATALSKLTSAKIGISLPQVQILDFQHICDVVGCLFKH